MVLRYALTWMAQACRALHASVNASPRRHEEHEGHEGHEGVSSVVITPSNRCSIEVHRLLRPGLLESVYEVALCRELLLRGVAFERQVSVPVHYKGESLNCQVKLDLLVTENVIVEVKAVERLLSVHRAQLLTYLRLQNLWLGLLINFNVEVLREGLRLVLNG
jgi:GxxExxY protein